MFELLPVLPPAPRQPEVRPKPPPLRTTTPVAPGTRNAPRAAISEPEPITPAVDAPAPSANPFAITEPAPAAEPALDAMVGRAKRDARAFDRELRKGKSGVPEVADTPWARFRSALEAAHIDRGMGVSSETYTAPDGQVIYRFRRNGRTMCRTGGSVGPKIGGAVGGGEVLFDVQGGGGRAGEIQCPSHAQWKRD
ncbi:hypothetical protein [Massilia sp. IC2-476]|uniref:hypothetical protein n=1 Tax=Massilia sp. IC2-476 TaxID=2887199 RepID=UPI001D1047B9|nr:hypothetical protein [Massilia sp. IC2-476]MCC2972548.1 hypothetical protein [Massilia sp. IC2-476]